MHLYFTVAPAARLPSSKGKLAKKIDTRAWGGNIVAAGSITHEGTYETTDATEPIPLPVWLYDALTPPQRPAQPPALVLPDRTSRYAAVVLERETAAVAAATEGGREAELFRAARAMGRFIAWGDLPRHVVETAFQSAAESTGLPPSQCRATLRSALNWSIAHAAPRRTA